MLFSLFSFRRGWISDEDSAENTTYFLYTGRYYDLLSSENYILDIDLNISRFSAKVFNIHINGRMGSHSVLWEGGVQIFIKKRLFFAVLIPILH